MKIKDITWGWAGLIILVAMSLMVASVLVLPAILFNGCAGIQTQAPQYKTLSIPFTDGTYLNFKVPSDMPDFMQFEQSFGMQLTSYALVIAYYAPGTPSMGGIGTESYVFIVDFYSEQPAVIVLSHFKQLAADNDSPENIDEDWIYVDGIPILASKDALALKLMELEQRDNVDGFNNILHVMEACK